MTVRDLVCESICNNGIVQRFDAVVAKAHKLGHHSERMDARFIAPEWLEKARSFKHTKHVLLRREPALREVMGHRWKCIWRCTVCESERVYGSDISE